MRGVEPPSQWRQALDLLCLPFHHTRMMDALRRPSILALSFFQEGGTGILVDPTGFAPVASSMPLKRSPE